MTAKQFLLDYIQTHPSNLNEDGTPIFNNIFGLIAKDYDPIYIKYKRFEPYWHKIWAVQEFNRKLIGFDWALRSHPDYTPYEMGWRFDEDSVCWVESEVSVIYKPSNKIEK